MIRAALDLRTLQDLILMMTCHLLKQVRLAFRHNEPQQKLHCYTMVDCQQGTSHNGCSVTFGIVGQLSNIMSMFDLHIDTCSLICAQGK